MNKNELKIDKMLFSVLIPHHEIIRKTKMVAQQINEDYKDKKLVIVGLLKGCFPFLAELIKYINIPHVIDFLTASSYYGGLKAHGSVKINMDINVSIVDCDVLIVDDIIDTGATHDLVKKYLVLKNPNSIGTCVMIIKNTPAKKVKYVINYNCFTIPDVFVIGFGLDYSEKYRHLPDVFKLVH